MARVAAAIGFALLFATPAFVGPVLASDLTQQVLNSSQLALNALSTKSSASAITQTGYDIADLASVSDLVNLSQATSGLTQRARNSVNAAGGGDITQSGTDAANVLKADGVSTATSSSVDLIQRVSNRVHGTGPFASVTQTGSTAGSAFDIGTVDTSSQSLAAQQSVNNILNLSSGTSVVSQQIVEVGNILQVTEFKSVTQSASGSQTARNTGTLESLTADLALSSPMTTQIGNALISSHPNQSGETLTVNQDSSMSQSSNRLSTSQTGNVVSIER